MCGGNSPADLATHPKDAITHAIDPPPPASFSCDTICTPGSSQPPILEAFRRTVVPPSPRKHPPLLLVGPLWDEFGQRLLCLPNFSPEPVINGMLSFCLPRGQRTMDMTTSRKTYARSLRVAMASNYALASASNPGVAIGVRAITTII
jgi:hypothetical protein